MDTDDIEKKLFAIKGTIWTEQVLLEDGDIKKTKLEEAMSYIEKAMTAVEKYEQLVDMDKFVNA